MNVKQEGSKNGKAYNPISSFRASHSLYKMVEEEAYLSKKSKSDIINERLMRSYRDDKPKPKVDRSAFYDCTIAEFVYECAVICYGKDLVKLKKSRAEQEKFISVIGPVVFKTLNYSGDLHPSLDTVLSRDYVSDEEHISVLCEYLINYAEKVGSDAVERLKELHHLLTQ